ncbi:armadillo-type protein [Chytriomyces sp. MP71]|nr:armadillo-type protein [Chytriomyces sp. MP71]
MDEKPILSRHKNIAAHIDDQKLEEKAKKQISRERKLKAIEVARVNPGDFVFANDMGSSKRLQRRQLFKAIRMAQKTVDSAKGSSATKSSSKISAMSQSGFMSMIKEPSTSNMEAPETSLDALNSSSKSSLKSSKVASKSKEGGGSVPWIDDGFMMKDTRVQFQSFSERIPEIKIDSVHRIASKNVVINATSSEDVDECFFVDGLAHWQDLNSTAEFTSFRREVSKYAQSLQQILYHQKEIVDAIVKYLENQNALAAEPLLSLVTLLARDLQEEFFPYFPRVLQTILTLIQKTDARLLEAIFNSIAYLFKYLSREQVRNTLHSRAVAILRLTFNLMLSMCPDPEDIAFSTLNKTLICLGHHITPETSEDLWDFLIETLQVALAKYGDDPASKDAQERLRKAIHLFSTLILLRRGSKIANRKAILGLISECFNHIADFDAPLVMPLLRCLSSLVAFGTLEDILVAGKKPLEALFASENSVYIFTFCELLQRLKPENLAKIVLPRLIRFLPTAWTKESSVPMLYLASLMDSDFELQLPSVSHELRTTDGCLKLPASALKAFRVTLSESLNISGIDWNSEIESLVHGDLTSRSKLASTSISLTVAQLIALPFNDFYRIVEAFFVSVVELDVGATLDGAFEGDFGTVSRRACVASLAAKALSALIRRSIKAGEASRLKNLFHLAMIKFISNFEDDARVFASCAEFVEACAEVSESVSLSKDELASIMEIVTPQVGSLDRRMRLNSLRIIVGLERFAPGQDIQVFQIALEIESIEDSLDTVREKTMLIKRIDNLLQAKLASKLNEQVAIRYCLALLSSKFSLLHPEASTVLINFAKANYETFWKYFMPMLTKTKKQGHKRQDFDLSFPELPSFGDSDKKSNTICTFLNKVLAISLNSAIKFQNSEEFGRRTFFESIADPIDRIDDRYYYLLLLKVLRSLPTLVEQKSSQLFPLYFELLQHSDDVIENGAEDIEPEEPAEVNKDLDRSSVRGTVVEFLHIFENLKDPAMTHDSSRLYQSFLGLLSNGDSKIQLLALNCVLTWKQPGVVAYADHLKGLTDDGKFRDFLSTLDLENLRNSVKQESQSPLFVVLIRILYGKLISKRGRGSSKVGLRARRNAIFAFMVSLEDADREFLVNLMVAPFESTLQQSSINANGVFSFQKSLLSLGSVWPIKYQLGFLNIVGDSVKQMKNHMVPMLPRVLTVIMYLMNAAESETVGSIAEESDFKDLRLKQLKDVRQLCIQRLAQLFDSTDGFDYSPYIPAIYSSIIDRRIPKFHLENTQSSSSLMDLLVVWSKKLDYVYFLSYRKDLIPQILGLLAAKSVQDSVVSVVLGILESFLDLDSLDSASGLSVSLIKPNMPYLIKNFEALLSRLLLQSVMKTSFNLTTRAISILAKTSAFVSSPVEAEKLMLILVPCLRKRTQTVSDQLKVDILEILVNFLPILPSLQDSNTRMDAPYFLLICQMLSALDQRASRAKAVSALRVFAELEPKLKPVASLVEKLNAFLPKRIEEPDFNLRFDAFTEIGQQLFSSLDSHQWLPILHSLVFSLQDVTEFSIRTSAAFCLSKFIEVSSAQVSSSCSSSELERMKGQVVHVLLPAVKKAVKSNVELVRSEFMTLLGLIVKTFPDLDEFKDMVVLLADADDEASFFSNVYHMQTHRRIRALKRMSELCSAGMISQANISNIFLPLVTHVIFEVNRQTENNMMNEAISTIAACATGLSWGKYHDLVKRFLKAIPRRPQLEKELIRVVVAILENFKFEMAPTEVINLDNMDIDSDDGHELDTERVVERGNLDQMQRIHTVVVKKLIPDLFSHLSKNDDENINLRVPVAVAITKLLMKLPEESMNIELPRLLTTVCQFLKNRLQDVRDGCRDALIKIAKELGPLYFPFIIKELQGALLRGYQLHVLGFTVHHLLVGVTETFGKDGYDQSIEMLVRIFVNDIFGEISDEREVQEMNGKLKEMKRTKSFDSFELVSRVVKMHKVTTLLLPLKEIMLESNSTKTVNKIQDILRKIVSGLSSNSSLDESELLVFVHGLITENLPLSKVAAYSKAKRTAAERRITVQMRRNEPLQDMLTYFKANAYMFIDFGLSLLLVSIKKDILRPNNPEHLKMMDPLVEVLGKSLFSHHSSVVINSLKIFSLLARWPLPALEVSIPVIIKRLFELFLKKGDGSAEKSDSALKLLGVIIKDCSFADINQKQIMTLITVLTPELEEPDRQGAAFALIRSILSRNYVFPEMYDLMAVVSKIMVTSQSSRVQEMCRQSHSQFLLEYPHGPVRLKKEFTYLLQNLNYEFESGRESVLVFLGLIIPKLSDVILAEYAELVILSLVMSLVNDDSANCREKASAVIKLLIKHAGPSKREGFLKLAEKWFSQINQPQLVRTAAQLIGLVVDSLGEKDLKSLTEKFSSQLISVVVSAKVELESDNDEDSEQPLQLWQAAYYSLNTIGKFISRAPLSVFSQDFSSLWEPLKFLLLYPHSWIRSIACNMFGMLFSSVNLENINSENSVIRSTLLDTQSILFLAMQFSKQLQSNLLSDDLAKQIVKNLLFLGKFVAQFHNSEKKEDSPSSDNEDFNDATVVGNHLLIKIFKRMAYISRAELGSSKLLMRKSVFQWFGAMILSLNGVDFTPYLHAALSVLYRTIHSHGQDPVYNQIQEEVQTVREDRKTKRKVQAIVDPESAAKRREQKNAMKKSGKKRKAEEFSKSRIRTGMGKRMRKE